VYKGFRRVVEGDASAHPHTHPHTPPHIHTHTRSRTLTHTLTRPHTPSHTPSHSHSHTLTHPHTPSHTPHTLTHPSHPHTPSPGAGERGGRGTQDAGAHAQVAHLQVAAGRESGRGRPPRPGTERGQAAGHRLWGPGIVRSRLGDRRLASRAQRRAESRRGGAARRRGGGGARGR
jgi:hypothetical protein